MVLQCEQIMRTKRTLNRQLLIYIGFSGAIFVVLYSVVIFNFFMFGLELHGKIILENEAKNYLSEYKVDPNASLPENSTLRSYRSLLDVPQVLLALYDESALEHGPMNMGHGDMKIFEEQDFDKYQDAFDVDSLCFNEPCEAVFFYSYNLKDNEWLYMVMGLPDTEKGKLHNTEFDNVGKILLFIAALFFISILVLTFLLIKKIGEPIANLTHWSNHLSLSNLNDKTPNLKFEELEIVAKHLKDAFIRINAVLENEKDFLSSASHELRTPITVLSTNLSLLNVLMEELPRDSREVSVVARLVRSTENMKQLTQTLLWLSKDPEDFPASCHVDLAQLLPQIIDENSYLIEQKSVEAIVHKEPCIIFAPEILCKIVLTNLVRNAFQYTQIGKVEVSFSNNTIEIINVCTKQESIDSDDLEYGFGIGLELVRRISNKLSWQFSSLSLDGGRKVIINFTES